MSEMICRVKQDGERLIAELAADRAPSRDWQRIRGDRQTVFRLVLDAAASFRVLRAHELPEESGGFRCNLDNEVEALEIAQWKFNPIVKVFYTEPDLKAELLLQSSTGAEEISVSGDVLWSELEYVIVDSRWLPFSGEILNELRRELDATGLDISELPTGLSARLLTRLRNCESSYIRVHKKSIEEFFNDLKRRSEQHELEVPDSITLDLYPYQREGLRWLQFAYDNETGCLLADDMGLGKTATAISLIASRLTGSPNLIVSPTTVVENWRREFEKFCSELSVSVYHGASRHAQMLGGLDRDCYITSYGTLRADRYLLEEINWNIVVLDEAHLIRNPDTLISEACQNLPRSCPIALTGTPFQNRPMDLWSIMEFVQPGLLGSQKEFRKRYGEAIHRGDADAARELERIVQVFMLRRLKSEVAEDLPDKIEVDQVLEMSEMEASVYRDILSRLKADPGASNASLFAVITPLRQLCCHPRLVLELSSQDPADESAKYRRLVEIATGVCENSEKALVFSSFLDMLDLMRVDLVQRFGCPVFQIDGRVDVEHRQTIVDDFSDTDGSAFLLLNPHSAGTGLNITAANYVVHYNREWNPAVEDQATDRAYRIGQTDTVFVYYLYYCDSVDEVIADRLTQKRLLGERLIQPTEEKEADKEALIRALQLAPS